MSKVVKLPKLSLCSVCASRVATGWRGTCFDCAPSADKSLKSYSTTVSPPSRVKSPVGMELELLGGDSRITDREKQRQSVAHLSPVVCSDGSIHEQRGGEIKLCKGSATIQKAAADVVMRARLAGCRAHKSCGLHVHLSLGSLYSRLRRHDEQRATAAREYIGAFLHTLESSIFDLLPPSRRSSNYSYRFESRTDYYSQMRDHYRWASLSYKYPTLEIRCHGSTVNPWKVVGWLDVCQAIQSKVQDIIQAVVELPVGSSLLRSGFSSRLNYCRAEELADKWTEFSKSLWVLPIEQATDLVSVNSSGGRYLHARAAAGGSLSDFRG